LQIADPQRDGSRAALDGLGGRQLSHAHPEADHHHLRGDDAVGAATAKDKKTVTPARPGGLTSGCRE
jgi:hypothetical protein